MNKTVVVIIIIILVILGGIYVFFVLEKTPESSVSIEVQPPDAPSYNQDATPLAGKDSAIYEFSKSQYEEALKEKKLIVLYYYANWCPICKEEVPKLYDAFNELNTFQVIGIRVNFNDSDTDEDEEALAREHGVAYQHTKVFVKNGERILKSPETWDKQRYLDEINKVL